MYEKQAKERQKRKPGFVQDNCPEQKGQARDKAGEAVGVSGKQIELAVAWLRINEPKEAVGIDDVSEQIAVAVAKKELGKRGRKPKDDIDNIVIKYDRGPTTDELNFNPINSNSNENTLRRLARDNPEMLDCIIRDHHRSLLG